MAGFGVACYHDWLPKISYRYEQHYQDVVFSSCTFVLHVVRQTLPSDVLASLILKSCLRSLFTYNNVHYFTNILRNSKFY